MKLRVKVVGTIVDIRESSTCRFMCFDILNERGDAISGSHPIQVAMLKNEVLPEVGKTIEFEL